MCDVTKTDTVDVCFGGQAHELWSDAGLRVDYTGRKRVLARFDGGVWRAETPPPDTTGDVKARYNELAQERELVSRLNAGTLPPLTNAYFAAAAYAADAEAKCADNIMSLPETLSLELGCGCDAVILPELLRLLLDTHGESWDAAADIISRCFTMRWPRARARFPIGALAALQPRDASLVRAVNEKLCERLWNAFPGDWRRIGENAVIRDGEADMAALGAFMCGRILCEKELLAGDARALYTLMPAKFEEV